MEYWAGSPPPLYAKCGTVPGRNFAHAYQDKHRAADVHPYICERQDQGREPSCWTVPGSRTGGVLQDYTNWTDQDLSAPHFPFALESQAQQLQGLRDYQAQERREREWLVGEVHRAAARDRERDRESERRRQREGWQARWEPWSPVHYRREPAKRSLSNSSYRELEAWAARYSHSLPRKRRLEAGLWGVAHGSQDTDRLPERVPWGHRGGAEPRTGAAHLTGVPCQPREWGRWERRDTQPAVSHRGSQLVTPDKTYPSDTKENESRYQKRGFSQPPGYIPPPPYNTPHSISPATQRDEKYTAKEAMASAYATWDWGASRHTYSTLPTPRKKDYSVLDFPRERGGAGEFINEEWKQRTWSDPGGHRQTGRAVTGQWTGSSAHPQNTPVQSHSLSPPQQCLEQPQAVALSETDSHSTNTEREVSLKKRRGRETIFCLVSRMGGVAGLSSSPEEPHKPLSLPLFTTSPLTAVSNSELGRASQNVEEPDASKDSPELADEVDSAVQFLQPDSRVTTQTPASVRNCNNKPNLKGALEWKGSEQIAAHREELLRAIRRRPKLQGEETDIHRLPNTTDSEVVLPEGTSVKALSPVSRRKEMQTLAPVSAKYPLWREPSSTGRVKSENPSPSYLTCEGELIKNLDNDCTENRHDVRTHPHNVEVRQLELKRDTESDSSSGLLVIDATCVVVRVEFIFPPKIEHVQYLCSPTPSEQTEPDPSPPINPMETDKEIQDDTTPTPDQTIDKSAPICSLLDMKESVTSFEELYLQEKVDEEHHISSHTSVSETDIPQQSEETNQLAESLSSSTSVPESETLEERAERILGIPFQSSCVLDKTENNEMKQLTKDEKDEDTPEEQVSEPSPETEEDVSVIDSDVLSYDQSSTDMLEESKMEQRGQICDVSVENSSNCLLDVKVMPDRDSENKLPFDPWHEAGQFGDVFFPPISCCPNLPLSFSNPPSHSSTDAVSLNNSRPSSPSHLLLTSPSQFISLSPHPGTESSSLSDEFPLYPSDGNVPVFPASCTPELSDSLSRLPSPPPSHSAHPSSSSTPPPSGPHSPSSSPPPSTSVPPSTSSTPSPSVPHSPSIPLSSCSSPPPPPSIPHSRSSSPPPYTAQLSPSISPPPPIHLSPSSSPPPTHSLSPSRSPPLPDPSSRAKSPEIVGKAFTPVLSAFTTPTTYIEEPRYPKALWDAVKCIRKHTAPDSENEEEGCEPWGPESVASDDAALDDLDLGLGEMSQRREENVSSSRGSPLEVAEDMEAERDLDMLVTSTRGERSSEKEPSGPAEDDTLSCSSTDSHGSGDTVIMGADGESEEETETEEETDYEADIISEEEEPNPNIGHCVTAGQEWSCTVGPKRYVVVEGQDEGDRELRSTAEPQNEGSWSEIQATTQQVEGTVECEKSDGVRNLEGTENRGLFGVMASEEAGGGMGDHHLNHP
ncbi:uncharacterized protein si:ch211-159e12.5 [Esox lucius]|uniref:uncharacterized protein si:ch211-159e12.5 n=1 Tax=Esox lucius TaxID=8010 RepID=UPI0014769657|nr:uncharacterized protein si:ch211-159e12.5 [Esox lucius]